MTKLFATSLVALGLAAAFPAANAQTADPATDPAAAPAGRPMMHRHQDRAFKLADRVEARLAYIRTALKITPAQQPQWDAFANVHRKHAAAMGERMQERRARFDKEKGATERRRPTAIERHEFQRARLTMAAQRLDELLAVEKPLYAVLSPEQQRVADEVLAPRGRGGRAGHGGQGGPGRFHRAGFERG
jgi:hypothetical protein